MSVVEKGPSTKDKLSSIVHGFDEFDLEMKKGTRVILIDSFKMFEIIDVTCSKGEKRTNLKLRSLRVK